MTSATLPRRILRPIATPPSFRSAAIGFLATMLAGLVVLVGASAAIGLAVGPAVMPNVSVGGVDVAGLDRAEAEALLAEQLPSLASGSATVDFGEDEIVVPYADLGRRHDLDAMLDSALAVGRGGNPVADGIARLRSLVHPTALAVTVHPYDQAALDAIAADISRSARVYPIEAAVLRSDTEFEVRPAADGRSLEPAAVAMALGAAVDNPDPADVRVGLTPQVDAPIVSTEAATAAAETATATVADLELTIPNAAEDEEPLALDAGTIASWVSFGPTADAAYAMRLDETAAATSLGAFAEDVNRDAVSARFTVAGSGLGGIVAAQTGRELNVAESTQAVLDALRGRSTGTATGSLGLVVAETEPSLTTAAAEEILPQMQMVSSWTTYYVPGEGNGFGNNISIPAWDLDGYNLAPGEWFSFWGGIGPVTVDRGYRYGGAIINGRSVAQGALAGGICSTSTTLFNAAMRFGLEIGERTAHYYYIDRYPTGLDATVAIVDDSVVDMTFRNDTEHPIVIRGFGSPGQVTFQIWSVPNGRTVALSPATTSNHRTAIETTQTVSSMAPGTARRVEYPHNGFDAVVSRTVYGPDGDVLHQNTWYSAYRAVNGITLVGPAAPADDPPDDEGDPPPDDPPDEEA